MKRSETNERRVNHITTDSRWIAVANRDAKADGHFYYGVKTTGVYCRPSCGARLPKPENIVFYASCHEAEQAGFRSCKRCTPQGVSIQDAQVALVTQMCRLIESTEMGINLKQLAELSGMSPSHLQRLFKKITGVTPKQYQVACRANRLRHELDRKNVSVTDAIYNSGFHSSSRFYETAEEVLGMTPTMYRSGGSDETIYFAIGDCSLGAILVAQTPRGVCAIILGDDPAQLICELQDYFPKANLIGADPQYEQLIATVIGFVENPAAKLSLPLDIRGTAFQQRVWQALRNIPVGATMSYSEIAQHLGMSNAARAVANACAANVLAVAIPCHRVVRQDGSLSGYRWGVARKRTLLERESPK